MRLNGVQRLGIVASVLWFFVGAYWANDQVIQQAQSLAELQLDNCVAANKERLGPAAQYTETWTPCWQQFPVNYVKNGEDHWRAALLTGLTPIPIAWLAVWLVLSVFRWVRRGFTGQ